MHASRARKVIHELTLLFLAAPLRFLEVAKLAHWEILNEY
jgi:hypothetical protein